MNENKIPGKDVLQHQGDEPHFLRQIVRTHQALMMGFSREVGMPASRFALMRLLACDEKGVGIMDLARQLSINAAAVTRQVKEMESEGLIRRQADPRDGRRHYVILQPKGIQVFKRMHERAHELEQSLLLVMKAEEMEIAAKTLEKLRIFIEELN